MTIIKTLGKWFSKDDGLASGQDKSAFFPTHRKTAAATNIHSKYLRLEQLFKQAEERIEETMFYIPKMKDHKEVGNTE